MYGHFRPRTDVQGGCQTSFDAIQFPEVELLSLYINIVKWFAALRQAGRCLSGLNKPSSAAFIHHQPIEVGSP